MLEEAPKKNPSQAVLFFCRIMYHSPTGFHEAVGLMRQFFLSQWFVEVHPQSRLSILAACEDPTTIATFDYDGQHWPLPQTGQMRLEYELLRNPQYPGFFCVTTSYRQEPNPIPGRHDTIFPMFEFEMHGGMEELMELEGRLLWFLGFGPMMSYKHVSYAEVAQHYGVAELTHAHEERMEHDFSPVSFITDFPVHTSPFWNMKYEGTTANKVDVILYGMETIGSAERSCDPTAMRDTFYQISNWKYAQTLFDAFGESRVEKELDEFLAHTFFTRSGWWIGVTRMLRAMQLAGILGKQQELGGVRRQAIKSSHKFA